MVGFTYMKYLKTLSLIIVILVIVALAIQYGSRPSSDTEIQGANIQVPQKIGLQTDFSKTSIDLELVMNGGPAKDGIPSIDNPTFISTSQASTVEDEDRLGIVVSMEETTRFYPYSILVYHEIVNDKINDTPVLVTFCPLCGSAIVYNPTVDGESRKFGVSGLLYQSNLLMYDRVNESLWSQSIGEAVIGDDLGKELSLIPSQVITFGEFITKYPEGEVLSRDTGFARDYDFYPYGDYDSNNSLIFPVTVEDNRLPAKEIMYVVNIGEESVAFKKDDLQEISTATIATQSGEIVAVFSDGEIVVTGPEGEIPGYHEMWFSWATHHQDNGLVWTED